MVTLKLKEAGLGARHTAEKGVFTNEHTDEQKSYRQPFSESNLDHQWDSHFL
jgi:hypothetical protein